MKIHHRFRYIKIIFISLFTILVIGLFNNHILRDLYNKTESTVVTDRNGLRITVKPNIRSNYALYATSTLNRFTELLLLKEDRHFYQHLGINPISTGELILNKIGIGNRVSASTIEQQLVKMLLEHENNRTIWNKFTETLSALPLDIFMGKDKVLLMYYNTIYFGNNIQGVETASQAYFNKSTNKLSDEEILQLLSSLGNPSYNNPLLGNNIQSALKLANQLKISVDKDSFISPEIATKNLKKFLDQENNFELENYIATTTQTHVQLSIDKQLTEKIRAVAQDSLPSLSKRDAHNMAIVVIKQPENEILSLIGSPDPQATDFGQQINMLTKTRQVASTIKPFVYVKAFENGMRPYTLIDDARYKYITFDGRTLYPKNYDEKFHGRITAAYALANSINVPAIKTLQFVGLDTFANFLGQLGYPDTQKVHDHQLGAALGTIDMNLLQLVHFYSIFPNQGVLKPLRLFVNPKLNRDAFPGQEKEIIAPEYTQLITKILSDRYIGIDQFGYMSNLNLPSTNYAFKTGTSDDYRDSWVVGFTPDYMVGVWVGNANNTPTKELSGQSGAGEIWSKVMQIMDSTIYNRNTPLLLDHINKLSDSDNSLFGLSGDNIDYARDLLLNSK